VTEADCNYLWSLKILTIKDKMKYLYALAVLLSACLFTSCEVEDIQPDIAIEGEWAYVGDFNHKASQVCQSCPTFKIDSALYKLKFNRDRTITGKINLLIMEGFYVTSDTEKQGSSSSGTIRVSKFNPLNKPLETPNDSIFQEKFRSSMNYYVSLQSSGNFDFLTLEYSDNRYLYFARKKK
jgi:hypothetical protein